MKRFAFSLERVLHFKRQLERAAELRQQQAALALQAARAEVAALKDRLDQAAAALAAAANQATDVNTWLARYQQSAYLGEAVVKAEGRAEQAARVAREANAHRGRIAAEVEALLVLRRQQWQAYKRQAERAQQEALDEQGLRRWGEARKGAAG